jgi:hypothetical protein
MSTSSRIFFLQRNSFFYTFFKKLNHHIFLFNKLFDINKIKITFEVSKKSDIQNISFLDENIQSFIFKNYVYTYTFQHSGFPTTLKIGSPGQILTTRLEDRRSSSSSRESSPSFERDGIKLLYLILCFQHFCNKNVAQEVYYYPTSFKKVFSKNPLSPREVNSGVTFIEKAEHHHTHNGKVILFRKEEVYKVCIHELIHSFHMDYPLIMHSHNMKSELCSNYPILLNEAYTESLATMLNLYFVYLQKERFMNKYGIYNIPEHHIINVTKLRAMFKNELNYELGLSKKVLNHNGLKYNELYQLVKTDTCLKKFLQHTNVFSYYVLKPLILNNIDFYDNFMKNYTKDGFINRDGINVLEQYILGILKDENSHYVKSLKRAKIGSSRSLKMVLYQMG